MALLQTKASGLSNESDLVRRAAQREESAIREIIEVHNRRLYRLARSVVRDDAEAEDVLQDGYLRAFSSLATFRGESSLGTWLTRIVLNEALSRARRRIELPYSQVKPAIRPEGAVLAFPFSEYQPPDPERAMSQRQLCQLVERAIDELPQEFRTIIVARIVEGMSVGETADLLGLRPETVKTRLHRARHKLREALAEHINPLFGDVFPFEGQRCQRLTDLIVQRITLSS
jgi:RNA polymerase sigma-70 factor (ECF subfamily)